MGVYKKQKYRQIGSSKRPEASTQNDQRQEPDKNLNTASAAWEPKEQTKNKNQRLLLEKETMIWERD